MTAESLQNTGTHETEGFACVDTNLFMAVRLIPQNEMAQAQSKFHTEFSFHEQPPLEVQDAILAEWLRHLNGKLDAILKALDAHDNTISEMTSYQVNISAGGIKFQPDIKLQVGDIVELKTRFLFDKPIVVSIIGKVSEVTADFVYITFISLTDEMRDLIIRFVFQKEREIIQSQRKD
jgi:hypothetical protein